MFDNEERELTKLGEKMRSAPKPENLDSYIRRGIELGIQKKEKSKVRLFANMAAVLAIAVFLTSIRTSPAFASYISKVPGFEYIVKLINQDKGLTEAVENNFVQKINASVTHDDLVFTITDIIMDSSKGIVFYSIENKGDHRFVNLKEMEFLDEKGERLKASVNWGSFINKDMNIEKKLEGKVEIDFGKETIVPDMLHIEVKLRETETWEGTPNLDKTLEPVWKFEIPVDKEKFESMQKVYPINQSVTVDEQKIIFKEVTITPTRVTVAIEYDKDNTKKILAFDNIRLVNEKGESWATIRNGVVGSKSDEYNELLYFQSNYFNNPKELYITVDSIRALDKERLIVEVDIDKGKLIKAPDNHLTLESIYKKDSSLSLQFNLEADKVLDSEFQYSPFDNIIKDARGIEYSIKEYRTSVGQDKIQKTGITIDSIEGIKGPLYLKIWDYPKRLEGKIKVKVK